MPVIDLDIATWKQISTGENRVDIRHLTGHTQIAYVKASALPVGFDSDTATMLVTTVGEEEDYGGIAEDEFLYAYAISDDASISVTEYSSFLSTMTTAPGTDSARFRVDSQPTSFENNAQFKIFYRIQSLPTAQQMVLKFESVNELNIMVRKINLWFGGREYLVYGDDGTHTVTGTFTSVPVFSVNGNVQGGGIHPSTGVTVSVAKGTGIFVAGSSPTNGDAVVTDTNANRATSQILADTNQSGVSAGSTFYLVFGHIGSNDASTGHYYLQWEEIF